MTTGQTPRQRAIEALERRRPDGPVPACELAFDLYEQWLGRPITHLLRPDRGTPPERARARKQYVRDTVEVYRAMDHCMINHWISDADELAALLSAYRDEIGDEFMLGFPADGTYGIPNGNDMMDFVGRLADDPQGVHKEASRRVDEALTRAERMRRAGADVVWMGADYAMNQGPFFSPSMFAEFVAPYLRQVIAGFKALGLYVIKHSDGDLNPIMDQIVDAGPHAIHSLDAIANMDIRQVKAQYGDRVALIGNVPHGPLQMKQWEQVREAATYCLTYGGAEQGGYIYSTSNAVFGAPLTGISIEAYRFMLQIRDEFTAGLRPRTA